MPTTFGRQKNKPYLRMINISQAAMLAMLARAQGIAERHYWHSLPRITPRRLTTRLPSIAIDKPIFFLGTQGGGLSLISRMIRRHKDVVSCSGNSLYWHGTDELQNHEFESLPKSLRLGSTNPRVRGTSDVTHPIFGHNLSNLYADDSLVEHFRYGAEKYNETDKDIIYNLMRRHIRAYQRTTAPRYCDKSQSYTLKIPFLLKCFPDAKLVLVSRNPYALCFGRSNANSRNDLTAKCRHWVNSFKIAFGDLKGKEHYFIRFEDFTKDPSNQLDSLLSFLELDKQADLLPSPATRLPKGAFSTEKWYPIESDPNMKYLVELGRDVDRIDIMREILEPLSGSLGYTPYV